jgi:hypothetical protein
MSCLQCDEGKIAPFLGMAICQDCPDGETSDPTHTMCILVPVELSRFEID